MICTEGSKWEGQPTRILIMAKQHGALLHWNPLMLNNIFVDSLCIVPHIQRCTNHILGLFATGILEDDVVLELLWNARNVWYCTWQDWASLIHQHHQILDILPSTMKLVNEDRFSYLMTWCYTQHIWTLKDEVNFHLQCSQHSCVCKIPMYIAQTLLDNGQSLQTRLTL